MKLESLKICSALVLLVAATACESQNPASPASAGSAVVVTDATITSPTPTSPANAAQFKFVNQPVTLVVGNGVSTGTTALTYTFEWSTDSGFASKSTKDGVTGGANGQTSVTLDSLAGGKTYYWRARSNRGSGTGPYSKANSFAIAEQVILQAPIPASPGAGGSVSQQPALSVNNARSSGQAGQLFYTFELAQSPSFSPLVFTATVPEQSGGQTSVQVTTPLTSGTTYSWRVRASDPSNAVTSPYSPVSSFQFATFDPKQAIFVDNPPDVGSWPETAHITTIDLTGEFVIVDFDRRQGPGQWSEAGFGAGGIQYTLGMCFNLNQQWYCSAVIQFWTGRELTAGGLTSAIARNWYYDARWGPMMGHQPDDGELVAVWVGNGNLRDSGKTYKERSNFVLLPFGSSYNAFSPSSAGARRLSFGRR